MFLSCSCTSWWSLCLSWIPAQLLPGHFQPPVPFGRRFIFNTILHDITFWRYKKDYHTNYSEDSDNTPDRHPYLLWFCHPGDHGKTNLKTEKKRLLWNHCNLTLLLQNVNLEVCPTPISQTKPKHATIQTKALNECILMVSFVSLLKRLNYFCIFQNLFGQRKMAVDRLMEIIIFICFYSKNN